MKYRRDPHRPACSNNEFITTALCSMMQRTACVVISVFQKHTMKNLSHRTQQTSTKPWMHKSKNFYSIVPLIKEALWTERFKILGRQARSHISNSQTLHSLERMDIGFKQCFTITLIIKKARNQVQTSAQARTWLATYSRTFLISAINRCQIKLASANS